MRSAASMGQGGGGGVPGAGAAVAGLVGLLGAAVTTGEGRELVNNMRQVLICSKDIV